MTTVDAVDDPAAAVAAAAEALREGHLAVLPTDTVYGVAADAFQPLATRRVFGAKRRSRRFPLSVLVRSPKQLLGLCPSVPAPVELLMAAYWPGPLTIVVPADPGLSWDLGENRGTVALRMPLDDVTLAVLREVGPLAMTSANLSGQPAATTAAAAAHALGDQVAVYVDAGARRTTRASTIIDLTRRQPEVLREGPVSAADALAVVLGELAPLEAAARLAAGADGEVPVDPTAPPAPVDPADGQK
jgi:tRNA threonylcarbamoyl adenosine modification protein (Sua5/YciO/YrdC/YwlC family)